MEHESTVRKKILLLMGMKNEGFKEYKDLLERYEELLEYIAKKILENYNNKNNCDFDYYQVVRGNYNSLLNSGIMTVLTKQHIPKTVS